MIKGILIGLLAVAVLTRFTIPVLSDAANAVSNRKA